MKVIAMFDLPDDINLDFCRTRVRVEQFVFPVKEVEENPAKARYSSPILIDWCPLKPMPKRYVEDDFVIETPRDAEACTHGLIVGRNIVINEILGETE